MHRKFRFQLFWIFLHPSNRRLLALETPFFSLLTAFQQRGILFVSGATMKLSRLTLAALLAGACGANAAAQTSPAEPQLQKNAPVEKKADAASSETAAPPSPRAEAYYNYSIGHLYEQKYETTNQPEFATQAIDAYKKAYALDPKSPVIGERLAEMYWKAQRIRDAVDEATGILKRGPNNLAPRRLLGRIYLRSLGDFSAGNGNSDAVAKAIEQYREIYRVDPDDTESALWLARLYRLRNQPDQAAEVLRGILKTDSDNEAAVEQLTQLLLDEGKNI